MVKSAQVNGQEPVVVTGLGLVSGLGFGLDAAWPRMLEGESAVRVLPNERFPLPIALPVRLGSEVPREGISERIRAAVPRSVWNTSSVECHLWLLAALEAMVASGLWSGKSGQPVPDAERTGIYVGTGGGAHAFAESEYVRVFTAERGAAQRDITRFAIPMYMSSAMAGQLSILAGIRGPTQAVSSACSSGSSALLTALDALRVGRVERAIAGGCDITLTATVLKGFANLTALTTDHAAGPAACRPFDATRSGLVLGDGAACLVLERADAAARRGAKVLATVLGGAANSEAHHLLAPREGGEGMEACMQAALADAGVTPERVKHVYAHGTGTRYNDACESAAISRLFPHQPSVSATKAQIGHTLGAAGVIDAVLAARSLATGRVPPLANRRQSDPECPIRVADVSDQPQVGPDGGAERAVLINSFAFGGHNVTLLLGPPPTNGGPHGA